MITNKGQLGDRTVTAHLIVERASQQTRPADVCPRHRSPLEGGPVWFRCPAGHSVPAADLDREYHPPGGAR